MLRDTTQFKVWDARKKDFFIADNAYLNGWAKQCGWQATLVYISLCRHADIQGKSFPSIQLIAEEHNVGKDSIITGIKNLAFYHIISLEKKRWGNGKFKNNGYTLIDKSMWGESPHNNKDTERLVANTDTGVVANTDTGHIKVYPYNKNIHNTIISKDIIGKVIKKPNEVNEVIELFKPLHPSYERFFMRKNERDSVARLIKKMGYNKLKELCLRLPKIISEPYSPRITSPSQLENKLGDLILFLRQRNQTKRVAEVYDPNAPKTL